MMRLLGERAALELPVGGGHRVLITEAIRGPGGNVDVDVPMAGLRQLNVPGEDRARERPPSAHAVRVPGKPEPARLLGGARGVKRPSELVARCRRVPPDGEWTAVLTRSAFAGKAVVHVPLAAPRERPAPAESARRGGAGL